MDFTSLYNHHERDVFAVVMETAPQFPEIASSADLLVDVACVALNRLPPRYIRHQVDYAFYLTQSERLESDAAVKEAVDYAFNFVRARLALHSRN
ncbi:late competence development ComFB family protein [Pelomonas sp. CA6]|uniref:late competence development ComFB family protein n=1 Tax=Pelomonas sp. CA6 TaxID=2907999 RepID=UPI001F4B66B1|nr:late competence development ComFB family protein [Pelomonas sp. CA6]MCH7342448.1 late competence development ComFB family protein [Pelomonas sp. CA6]